MRKAIEARREKARAASSWSQNLPNTLQTLFQCTCEFPCKPTNPMAMVAPFPEKSNATINTSITITIVANILDDLLLNPSIRVRNAYALAIAFATTKYLPHEKLKLI